MHLKGILRQNSAIFTTENKSRGGTLVKVEKELVHNGFRGDECKINRIPIVRNAVVKFLHAESPSLVWIQLQNTIRDQLVVREPNVVDPLPDAELLQWNYCLVPIEERVFGRARILQCEKESPNVLLFLIDDGKICWANRSSLASLKSAGAKDFVYHPWQAVACSLAEMKPALNLASPTGEEKWSSEVCAKFLKIMQKYDLIHLHTVMSATTINDHGRVVAVTIDGIDSNGEEYGIGEQLLSSAGGEVFLHELIDGGQHKVYDREDADRARPIMVPPYCAQFPENWKTEAPKDERLPATEWAMELTDERNTIDDYDLESLRSEGFMYKAGGGYTEEVFVAIEGEHTKSPWEFYARPIRLARPNEEGAGGDAPGPMKTMRDAEALIAANEDLKKQASELDEFYSQETNRKVVKKDAVQSCMKSGKRVFAICEAPYQRSVFTGKWQRIEVIRADQFATVRWIDSGGVDIVMYGSIFHLHPSHCKWRALCMQWSSFGILPVEPKGIDWWKMGEADECRSTVRFIRLLHEDRPVALRMLGRQEVDARLESNGFRSKKYDTPYERAGVIFVDKITPRGDPELLQQLCTENLTTRADDQPIPRDAIRRPI